MMKSNNSGLTLIELIIVLAILSILVSLIVPKIDSTNYRLKTEARLLCNEIRDLRLKNMTESLLYKIYIHSDNYQLHEGPSQLKRWDVESGIKISDNFGDENISYTKLSFNNNGAPNYSGTITIKDINSGKYMEITIVLATGRVLLKDEIYSP